MNQKHTEEFGPGTGPTKELSLRLSVGALVRVLCEHPGHGDLMLALERKATLREDAGHGGDIRSQPFGGAIRILDLRSLYNSIGNFHFDSEESRAEQDFRIFIRHAAWETVLEFCRGHFRQLNNPVLESDPTRELKEEFADALRLELQPDQYTFRSLRVIVEDRPSATEYIYATGYPTVRIYRVFEARILDPSLASAMIKNSESRSDQDLRELALENSRTGGSGRANAVLTLPFEELRSFYAAVSPDARNKTLSFQDHLLDETVTAVLDDVAAPKYRRL
jgi:hypothetical protein